jgi:hypothetical protein
MASFQSAGASRSVDKPEQLRVVEENIDVVAFAMAIWIIIAVPPPNDYSKVVAPSTLAKLVNQVDSDAKKPPPFGRASAIMSSHYAASG